MSIRSVSDVSKKTGNNSKIRRDRFTAEECFTAFELKYFFLFSPQNVSTTYLQNHYLPNYLLRIYLLSIYYLSTTNLYTTNLSTTYLSTYLSLTYQSSTYLLIYYLPIYYLHSYLATLLPNYTPT